MDFGLNYTNDVNKFLTMKKLMLFYYKTSLVTLGGIYSLILSHQRDRFIRLS